MLKIYYSYPHLITAVTNTGLPFGQNRINGNCRTSLQAFQLTIYLLFEPVTTLPENRFITKQKLK